jgi:hypothetical protein
MSVNVQDVVTQYMVEKGFDSKHQFNRLLNIAISGLKELHYDVTGEPVFTQLELDSTGTAEIPAGMINVIKMWLNVKNIGYVEIVQSDTLPTNIVSSTGEVSPSLRSDINDEYVDEFGYYDDPGAYYQGGEFTGRMYRGVGDPNPFKYRINTATNKFEFSSNVKNPILEYLGTMTTVKGKHICPPFAVDALIAWLRHAENRNKAISHSEKQYNQRMWLAAKNMVLRRMADLTAGSMRNAARSSYSLTTK